MDSCENCKHVFESVTPVIPPGYKEALLEISAYYCDRDGSRFYHKRVRAPKICRYYEQAVVGLSTDWRG